MLCCEKAKLPSAGALICRQLQMSVGPCLIQPINNGICALTQTDSPKLSGKGRQRMRGWGRGEEQAGREEEGTWGNREQREGRGE